MSDFGIPHLAVGQADIVLARLQLRVRPPSDQSMPVRRARLLDRVVVGFRPLAPSVENAQHERTGTRTGVHLRAASDRCTPISIREIDPEKVAFLTSLTQLPVIGVTG